MDASGQVIPFIFSQIHHARSVYQIDDDFLVDIHPLRFYTSFELFHLFVKLDCVPQRDTT